ncbi:MAG: C1 family peptidase [Symbiobacteriia bacterium]
MRTALPPVQNQGRRGTCVAFAATIAHEHSRGLFELSPEFLYWACKQVDGILGEGTRLEAAVLALQSYGQCLDVDWPYQPEPISHQSPSYWPSTAALNSAGQYRALGSTSLPDVKAITHELNNGNLVVLAVQLFRDWFSITGGQIPMPVETSEACGLHAVLAVGYTNNTPDGHLIIRNSWGEKWGTRGYAYLPQQYVSLYQHGSAYVVLP